VNISDADEALIAETPPGHPAREESITTEERNMNSIIAYCLAFFTISVGHMAYTLCLTANEAAMGGILPFALFTISPIGLYYFGRITARIE
jgi:hypothetical protein